jgi:hypothetical protein
MENVLHVAITTVTSVWMILSLASFASQPLPYTLVYVLLVGVIVSNVILKALENVISNVVLWAMLLKLKLIPV